MEVCSSINWRINVHHKINILKINPASSLSTSNVKSVSCEIGFASHQVGGHKHAKSKAAHILHGLRPHGLVLVAWHAVLRSGKYSLHFAIVANKLVLIPKMHPAGHPHCRSRPATSSALCDRAILKASKHSDGQRPEPSLVVREYKALLECVARQDALEHIQLQQQT